MRGALGGVALAVIAGMWLEMAGLSGCDEARARVPSRVLPSEEHYVREWFALEAGARCRTGVPRLVATEPRELAGPARRVPEDLLVLEIPLECTNPSGAPRTVEQVLPKDAALFLEDARGVRRAPSLRTKVSDRAGHIAFEVARGERLILAPRTFDARTGRPLFARDHTVGRLMLELGARKVAIALRPREHDETLDAAVSELVRALVNGSDAPPATSQPGAFRELARLASAMRQHFAPRQIELASTRSEGDMVWLELVFAGSPWRDAPTPIARLTLGLGRSSTGALGLARVRAGDEVLHALECEDASARLHERVAAAYDARSGDDTCNALGVLLPGRCNEVDPALLERAISVRSSCLRARGVTSAGRALPPDDFQLTVRRGATSGALDRTPRYVLSLFANGSVVFHGRHWVSTTGRNDGRTAPSLLAALYERFVGLDWFDRRGGVWDAEDCDPQNERQSVITLHAAGRERMVLDADGCRGPFSAAELLSAIELAEAVAGVSGWTTPRPRYADQGLLVWDVNPE